ncbi:carbohydrate kinase [Synechococcus sp. Tobar12-5m-g]|uniref:carbohydrate kinase family protein n=1 Tax=unclassified Synechococcus TaxID=2626047 RepID=UPI0020CE39A5|nr:MULTISPECIES: carbohydrate kinase [unclassified Synechococcus]MCP9771999.1 carbohydrate kinase [Synechococcus sp. Tobar12-5m-g]MCP9872941.1 carbohydrate kinase [Synechococcus sp. Cruz CV-v-12]
MIRQPPPRVLCFGEALVDRLGPPGGDPARDGPVDDRLGGAPANVACALARLGTPAALIGRLGDDAIGAAFGRLLWERGVDTRALQRDPLRPSRIVLVKRDAGGDRSFGGFAGELGEGFADQALDAEALARPFAALLNRARWLLIGTIPLASPASGAALLAAVEQAATAEVPLALDLNWRPSFWPIAPALALERIRPMLERAALLKLSAEEADWIGAGGDPQRISASLPQRPAVVVTDGARGLRWWLGGQAGSLVAFPVTVVDTTGAGDAFLAGLLHGLCADPSLLTDASVAAVGRAMRFAAACGALVCAGAGAIDPQPDEAAVETFLERAS